MQTLSSKQNQNSNIEKLTKLSGLEENVVEKLRVKQKEVISVIGSNPNYKYLFNLPGGYGKKKAAIAAYITARNNNVVNRLLIVAPSVQQASEWLDCKNDFDWFNCSLKEFEQGGEYYSVTNMKHPDWALKRHNNNTCEIYVVTIQTLTQSLKGGSTSGIVNELTSNEQWMIIAEEAHHYCDEKTWGEIFSHINCRVLIGLSATPFRSKGRHIFSDIIGTESVVYCSLEEAMREEAVRRLYCNALRFNVEFEETDTHEKHSFLTSEIAEYLKKNGLNTLDEYEAKNKLRALDSFIQPIFTQALRKLSDLNMSNPDQHQMIVHAPSVSTAKVYTRWLRLLTDEDQNVEWVGTCPERKDEENQDIIKRFKNNKLLILVQVQMFGEGSDNIRASVGVWLSLMKGDTPSAVQGIVRHIRRNTSIPFKDDVAYMFVPDDSPALDTINEIMNKGEIVTDEKKLPKEKDSNEDKDLILPDLEESCFEAINAELLEMQSPEIIKNVENGFKSKMMLNKPDFVNEMVKKSSVNSYAEACQIFDDKLQKELDFYIREKIEGLNPQFTEEIKWDKYNKQIENTVKRIVSHYINLNFPNGISSDKVGKFKTQINKKLYNKFKVSRDKKNKKGKLATVNDLYDMYNYLCTVADRVNQNTIKL